MPAHSRRHNVGARSCRVSPILPRVASQAEARAALEACAVRVAPYEDAEAAVRALCQRGGKVLLDPWLCNFGLRSACGDAAVLAPSPVTLAKATKNAAELAGMLEARGRV